MIEKYLIDDGSVSLVESPPKLQEVVFAGSPREVYHESPTTPVNQPQVQHRRSFSDKNYLCATSFHKIDEDESEQQSSPVLLNKGR